MEYFLDSNIFLRFLVPDDNNPKFFSDCKKLFNYIETRKITVSTASYIYAEIVWVLKSFYHFKKHKIIEALRVFEASSISIDNRVDQKFVLDLFEKYNVKFIDCLIASHKDIQKGAMAIVSYDKDFDVLGIKRFEPQDVKV